MRLSVIGCGHLGAVHAACMADIGHQVLGVDINEVKAEMLNSGKAWFREPGLDEMLSRNVAAGRLRFTTSPAAAAQFAAAHFLGVATPGLAAGTYDLSQLEMAVAELAQHITGPTVIIGKSTVPPGTTASLGAIAAGICRHSIDFAWNPEFLREGCAVRDTLAPDRIVIGAASDTAEAVLRDIYRPLTDTGTPLVVTDFATAELVKCAANAFLATKISFINSMADICQAVGGDARALAEALGMDPRIGKSFLNAGIGYGGGCLPKDLRGLAAFADQAGARKTSELLMAVDGFNTARRAAVVRLVGEAAAGAPAATHPAGGRLLAGKRIAVWGAAFKPGTDDIRDSPGLDIACRLHDLGAHVTIYDPLATGNALEESPQLTYADSALEAARDADAVLVATAWPEFAGISPLAIQAAASSTTVVDACQGINDNAWQEAGWKVLSLTNKLAEAPHAPTLVPLRTAAVGLADYRGDRRIQDIEAIGCGV
jgi:UDPglucose 6-dehydrogenase